ncbi:rhomboid family intramembrane serine protease [Salinivibrio sharmensis]|uniref:Rhomboid family intramembrane serine protease n=1 Tax=Salinivibrio sharmensis TaxID=390883 RepID=A0ABX3KJA9_9GAMM|nr:rhomboid family intramembrane serine protease [Salinivibrio sharmensis]OOE89342.1 rhomboid family intramembrane serine protease [Salinivibrio sharmensis]
MTKRNNCPKCKNQELLATEYQGETIDVCRGCGGLWFEKMEVNRMIEEVNDGPVGECFSERFGDWIADTELACPECDEHMTRHHLLENFHVEIDVCRQCNGSWIDKEELEAVEKSPVLKETLDHLNQKISWKTYLFQMLTAMPVEYNIKPQSKPWINWSLIAINILIFLTYAANDSSMHYVLDNFAMVANEVSHGEKLYTLLTATFLHGGLMHLAGNMYFLFVVGDNIEDILGHKKYLMLYLLCGLGASLISMVAHIGSAIPALGASGAIAGLFGIYLVWFRNASLTFMFFFYQRKLSAAWFFAIWLGFNLLGALSGEMGVDYAAHIGGFVIGLGIGLATKEKVWQANPLVRLINSEFAQIKRT